MDCCDDRSACRRSTAVFRLFVVISLLACSPLAGSRQTITTVAPICASASAVAFPIPELAPVTMQIFPCILLFTVGMMQSFHVFLYSVNANFIQNRLPFGAACHSSWTQPKRWVLVGDQDERVGSDPAIPTDAALHASEQPSRIVPGEQDGAPADDHHHDPHTVSAEQHRVERQIPEPLRQ